jgi:hypothetical protein
MDASHRTCQQCEGSGFIDGLYGFPDEDGTYPIGWEPPHRPQLEQWFGKVWDTSDRHGGKNL